MKGLREDSIYVDPMLQDKQLIFLMRR